MAIPPELGPAEDLTRRVETAAAAAEFPFDGEPAYEKIFDAAAQVGPNSAPPPVRFGRLSPQEEAEGTEKGRMGPRALSPA